MLNDLLARAARHVKPQLSPQEYMDIRKLVCSVNGKPIVPYDEEAEVTHKVWQIIPRHTIARCPLCGEVCTEQVDTYNLRDVGNLGEYIDTSFKHYSACEHLAGEHGFLHLNGVIPDGYFHGRSEVPYVDPNFLPDDPRSCAVMHCLPIWRAEGEAFVPRSLLFVVTYYSKAPETLYQERIKVRYRLGIEPLPKMYSWREARGDKDAWDLVRWVRMGKLWWLDLDRDDLPLRNSPVEEFPYANIQGIQQGFTYYHDGKFELEQY